jgi:hypothetical protein
MRIREVIANTARPSWVESVPQNFGSAAAGTVKAAEWFYLVTIFLPIALISFWGEGTLHNTPQTAEGLRKILDHTMLLVSVVKVLCYNNTSPSRARRFRDYLIQYIEGIKQIHGHTYLRPNHHMALHIYDFLLSFGPVRSWWMFPYERLNGHLQRLPQNHRYGKWT